MNDFTVPNKPGCKKHGKRNCRVCAVVDADSVIKSLKNKDRVKAGLKKLRGGS